MKKLPFAALLGSALFALSSGATASEILIPNSDFENDLATWQAFPAKPENVSIDTNLFFSDVLIETSGGTTPVTCHGHRKADAVRMKQLIEEYQTTIYRTAGHGHDRAEGHTAGHAAGGSVRQGVARG